MLQQKAITLRIGGSLEKLRSRTVAPSKPQAAATCEPSGTTTEWHVTGHHNDMGATTLLGHDTQNPGPSCLVMKWEKKVENRVKMKSTL